MSPEQKELFHKDILLVLDSNRSRWGMGVPVIMVHLVRFGFMSGTFGGDDKFRDYVADALQYLCDKGLAEEVLKHVDKANRSWRISTAGIDYIDSRG